jgi:hypothetical protein
VQVTAVAYDNPIPGFKTRNCINLRLWAAKPSREFDLEAFNTGDYVQVGGGAAAEAHGVAQWQLDCGCFSAVQPIAGFAGTTIKHAASTTWLG